MHCRHTVPDWHRYTDADAAVPIFAGCRLLIQSGERVSDPRTIACTFWGRQTECPLYEGPGKRALQHATAPPDRREEALPAEPVWPVRQPGARDWSRVLLMTLAVAAVASLGWAGMAVQFGGPDQARFALGIAIAVSVTAHVLAIVRCWARP